MAFVAWWTGRGYRAILIVIGTTVVVELLRAALKLREGAWAFGVALLAAAVANWFYGRKLNSKSLAKVRSLRVRDRIVYRAGNRFMSFAMETFSVVIGAAGLAVLIAAITGLA